MWRKSRWTGTVGEFRRIYPVYLREFHRPNRVDIKHNASPIGSDRYRIGHWVYVRIKEGPRKGEEFPQVKYDKEIAKSDLRVQIGMMRDFLASRKVSVE